MPAFVTIGRVLFAVLFIFSGASKLLDIAATTQVIAAKVVLPVELATYTAQIESVTGMPFAQLLAILAGALELIGGLLIALNFGARFFAVLLILFVIVATWYFHDFWNQTGPEARGNMIHALKNLSLIGGLLMIVGIERPARSVASVYADPPLSPNF
jgi:uncharacterized membrane protein YphA (DoxX/SURF4 family)